MASYKLPLIIENSEIMGTFAALIPIPFLEEGYLIQISFNVSKRTVRLAVKKGNCCWPGLRTRYSFCSTLTLNCQRSILSLLHLSFSTFIVLLYVFYKFRW